MHFVFNFNHKHENGRNNVEYIGKVIYENGSTAFSLTYSEQLSQNENRFDDFPTPVEDRLKEEESLAIAPNLLVR